MRRPRRARRPLSLWRQSVRRRRWQFRQFRFRHAAGFQDAAKRRVDLQVAGYHARIADGLDALATLGTGLFAIGAASQDEFLRGRARPVGDDGLPLRCHGLSLRGRQTVQRSRAHVGQQRALVDQRAVEAELAVTQDGVEPGQVGDGDPAAEVRLSAQEPVRAGVDRADDGDAGCCGAAHAIGGRARAGQVGAGLQDLLAAAAVHVAQLASLLVRFFHGLQQVQRGLRLLGQLIALDLHENPPHPFGQLRQLGLDFRDA